SPGAPLTRVIHGRDEHPGWAVIEGRDPDGSEVLGSAETLRRNATGKAHGRLRDLIDGAVHPPGQPITVHLVSVFISPERPASCTCSPNAAWVCATSEKVPWATMRPPSR